MNRRCAHADYVLALKGNQEKIHEDVKAYFEDGVLLKKMVTGGGFCETTEKDHGRIEMRRYYQTDQISWLPEAKLWDSKALGWWNRSGRSMAKPVSSGVTICAVSK